MITFLRNLIKMATVDMASSDDGELPIQQILHNGKTTQAFILFPYGIHANLPPRALLTTFNIFGNEQNKVAMGGLPQERIKELKEGEVVFFHPLTKSKIHFKENGDIDIESIKDLNLLTKNVNGQHENVDLATKNITINADGTIEISANELNLTANLNVTGDTVFAGKVTANGKRIDETHTHLAGSPPGTTGVVL